MTYDEKKTEIENYWSLSGFEEVYLEDSYVLGIEKTNFDIRFDLEIVLREAHPSYEEPDFDSRYCYRKAVLLFKNITSIEVFDIEGMLNNRSVDPDGSIDFGHIDTFEVLPGNLYSLTGDWGKLKITSDLPSLELEKTLTCAPRIPPK